MRASKPPTLILNLSDEARPVRGGVKVRRQMLLAVGQPAHRLDLELGVERAQPEGLALVVLVAPPFAVVRRLPADRAFQVVQLPEQRVVHQADVVRAADRAVVLAFAGRGQFLVRTSTHL